MSNFVSIVLPTYNRAHILKKSIQSVLAQTYSNFELIIVDDGSTDSTKELIDSFCDPRINYMKTPVNSGASAARNYGMAKAQGDFIAFEDSDDLWHPNKLEEQINSMTRMPEAGFSYHKLAYDMGVNEAGQSLVAILPDSKTPLEKKNGDIYGQLLHENMIGCPTLLVRHEVIDKVGFFDESLKALEDYDYALRIAREYKAVFVDEVLVDATYSSTGVSGSSVNYLTASCMLIYKYKTDYIKYDCLNHRLEAILRDSEIIGMRDEYIKLLEKVLS